MFRQGAVSVQCRSCATLDPAYLLLATNRLDEALPLIERAVDIYRRFKLQNAFEHPHWDNVFGYYGIMLRAVGLSEAEVAARMSAE